MPENNGIITNNVEQSFKDLKKYWNGIQGMNSSSIVDMPSKQLKKLAMSSVKPGISRQAPSFYHPLFEAINLQLPTKSFYPGSLITKEDGTQKHIEDFVPGERIISHDGTIETVEFIENHSATSSSIKIHSYGTERPLIVTSGHKVVVWKKEDMECDRENKPGVCVLGKNSHCKRFNCNSRKQGFKMSKLEAFKIKKGDYVCTPILQGIGSDIIFEHKKYNPAINDFVKIKDIVCNRDMMRLLGYYASEGSIAYREDGTPRTIVFTVGLHEKETLGKEIKELIYNLFGVKAASRDKKVNVFQVELHGKTYAEFFIKHCGVGSKNKKLSNEMMFLSPELQIEFLGAYINGDGHQRKDGSNKGSVRITTASQQMANQLLMISHRCGLPAKKGFEYRKNGFAGKGNPTWNWHVDIPGGHAGKLINVANVKEYEKRFDLDKIVILDKWILFQVYKTEEIKYDGLVYNIGVNRTEKILLPYKEDHILLHGRSKEGNYFEVHVPIEGYSTDGNHTVIAEGIACLQSREINQWCRHFMKTDPLVGNLISLHSEFPLSGMHIVCDDPKIKKYFEILFFDVLNGEKLLFDINLEYWKIGNVFPFGEWLDDKKIWRRFVVLNPDYVEVEKTQMVDEPVLKLDPDDNIKRIVQSRQPKELYEQLKNLEGGQIINLIARGEKIPLNKFRVSHLAYKLSPYETVGTPIMFRAFKALIYKDIIRRAQMAIAERHITPIKVVKVGNDQIPATPEAITAAKEAFDEVSTDLSSWFFYHHAIQFDYVSANGKILPLNTEYDWIEKEVLAALMGSKVIVDGSGPNFACYDEQTETLTENGFKMWHEVDENEKIATFNPENEELEYHIPYGRYVYDYDSDKDGKMVQFKTTKIDSCVTPNHRMYIQERFKDTYKKDWEIKRADEVKNRTKFRSQLKWKGKLEYPEKEINGVFNKEVNIMDFLKLAGHYISEGWVVYNKGHEYRVGVRQLNTSKHYNNMMETCKKFGFHIYDGSFVLNGERTEQYFEKEFGRYSVNKHVPKWMKNLPKEYLKVLLESLMMGDGNIRPNTKKKITDGKYYSYATTSKKLADDVYEIVYKLGYVPTIRHDDFKRQNNPNKNTQYFIYWSDGNAGRFPVLMNGSISRIDYKGKVYCFEVPNHLFITRRNGKVTIQGNTASVGLQILINRYMRNQQLLQTWVKNNIFKPVAVAQEFTRVNEFGEKEYIVPELEFEFMRLKDDQAQKTLMKELMKVGLLSKQTFFSYIGLNYEREKRLVDKEKVSDQQGKLNIEKGKGKPEKGLGGGGVGGGGMGGGVGETPAGPGPAMEEKGLGGGMGGPGEGAMPETV